MIIDSWDNNKNKNINDQKAYINKIKKEYRSSSILSSSYKINPYSDDMSFCRTVLLNIPSSRHSYQKFLLSEDASIRYI
jgi:hypothetical protein